MKRKLIAVFLAAMVFCPGIALSAGNDTPDDYRKALRLYEAGMFERAGSLFYELYEKTGDAMAKGYGVLCTVRLQEVGNETAAYVYADEFPYSKLVPQIHFYTALNHFDRQEYEAASREFSKVPEKALHNDQIAEYYFKSAYAYFELEELDRAMTRFAFAEKLPHSDFTAPSRYSLGYICYIRKNFDAAYDWFEKAGKDPRFEEQALNYMIECRYMKKDYTYVIDNGTKVFDKVSKERRPHLAKLISESYLARGNSAKAKEYYDRIESGRRGMDDDDLFYAGSVLYATGDYGGAVENYSKMQDRTDSIGQIANYQMGYSNIRTGNKVAALNAFKDASEQKWNLDVQEDAHFNYAKLSFDLNHNPSVFNDYMSKYSDKKKGDQIYSYMALASLYNHDYAGAVDAYANIDNLDDNQRANYMRANYLRANQLIENGSWRDAVPLLKAASYYADKHNPFGQLSRYWLGESYYRSGQFDDAIETFRDLYNNSALDGKAEGKLLPYDMAYSYFRKEDYTNAAKWFDEYLSGDDPAEGEDAAIRRADCDFIRRDYATAIQEYEDAAGRFPYSDNLYPFYRAGIAYGLTGNMDKKVEVLSRALKADPSAEYYSEAMYELGRAYVATGSDEKAVSTFDKLRTNTRDKSIAARSLIDMGMILRNLSEYDKALGCFKQVIEEMPGTEYSEDALLAIESIYQGEGRMDEYLDYADKIGANKDKSAGEKEDMYFNAAEQLYLSEHWSKALGAMQNYLERFPQGKRKAKASFCIAESYRGLGNKEQACDWYAKAVSSGAGESFVETAMLNFSALSYDLQRYKDAFGGYSSLLGEARLENNKHTARVGMMRSAFKAADYLSAISCAEKVKGDKASTAGELREADYTRAKSYLSTNDRDKAFAIFETLAARPSTSEGAEAAYMIIQDAYDQGLYGSVEKKVYAFAEKAGDQNYWLAKSFIVLGDSFAEQDNLPQAKATFESVLNGYKPADGSRTDDVLDNVTMRLDKLNNLMK